MEIFTPTGSVPVTDLSVGDAVYTLDPELGLAKPQSVVALEQVTPNKPLVAIETRRATIHISANQLLYYCTDAIARPRTVVAEDVTERTEYKFLNEWQSPGGQRLEVVDITDLTDRYEARIWTEAHGNTFRSNLPANCTPTRCNSHTGYYFDATTFKQHQEALESLADSVAVCSGSNTRGRPYRFDGDDFLRFLGWFITEGSVHWSATSDTAQVSIAQDTPTHRQTLRSLFDRLGITVSENSKRFQFSSKLFGELLERLCGPTSAERHLPWFVWTLSQDQKRLLLETLLDGDGNARGTYYTASEQLACDVLRLATELGISPRYSTRDGVWRVYLSQIHDGFHSRRHVRRLSERPSLVRLTVEDYPAVLVGADGTFQWVGVSCVA
jgi:DNA polymerase I